MWTELPYGLRVPFGLSVLQLLSPGRHRRRTHTCAHGGVGRGAVIPIGHDTEGAKPGGFAPAVRTTLVLVATLAVGCSSAATGPMPSPTVRTYVCSPTPSSVMLGRDGTNLIGFRGGDIFLFTARAGPFHANPPEKFSILLANPPGDPRALSVKVHGRNLATGSSLEVRAENLTASWGDAWGAIYRFPDAGCWELAVDQEGNRGSVVIEVTVTCPEDRASFCPDATASP